MQYYHSNLSIWISVDPLADKYPNLSPYTYCADNPVRLVDPDGRDVWEISENGKIINQFEDKSIDQFYIVDSKGNCIAESESYNADTKCYIYTRDKGYSEYNKNTRHNAILLDEFIIYPK